MLPLLLAASLLSASMAAGERPVPSTAYEVSQAQIAQASAKDAVWLGITASADIYSTAIGLHRCPTCREGNWLAPTPEARIAIKAGIGVAQWFGLRKLRHDGHPRLANVLRWTIVGMNLAFTANNSYHAVKGR